MCTTGPSRRPGCGRKCTVLVSYAQMLTMRFWSRGRLHRDYSIWDERRDLPGILLLPSLKTMASFVSVPALNTT
ncbi:uncharacterized [Tachysurus ichikawai]